jgi:hypothetical protein
MPAISLSAVPARAGHHTAAFTSTCDPPVTAADHTAVRTNEQARLQG